MCLEAHTLRVVLYIASNLQTKTLSWKQFVIKFLQQKVFLNTSLTKEATSHSLIPVYPLPSPTFAFRVVKEHGIGSEGIDVHMRSLSKIFFLLL